MEHNLRLKIEEFAQKHCKEYKDDPKLWENHVQLVRRFALHLAEIEKVDEEVVEIAALLHDIGKDKGRKGHSERSHELSRGFLEKVDLPNEKKDLILKCILKHDSKHSGEDNEIEVKVIQSADALGTFFDEEWQKHSRETLPHDELLQVFEKSYNKISLESARKIAKPQIDKLKHLLK